MKIKASIFNKRNSFLFLFLLFTCCSSFYAQNKYKSDSLLVLLKQNKTSVEEKILLLKNIATYHPKNDTVLFILKEALKLSKKIKAPIIEAEIWEEMVYVEKRLGNNPKSLTAAFKALTIYESLSLKKEQGASYAQIAEHYISEKEYTSAILYLEKAKAIYTSSNDFLKEILTLLNLGEVYRLSDNLEKATATFSEVLMLNNTPKEKDIEAYAFGNLGMVYNAKNNLNTAEDNLKKAIEILTDLGNSYASSVYLNELGKVYDKQGNAILAEKHFLKAFQLAKKDRFKEQIRDFSKQLANYYKKEKQFKKALGYQQTFQIYQDSLINKKNIQKIEQVKSQYQVAKKETEITLLNTINKNQQNAVIGLIIGVSILLVLFYFLYKGSNKIKNKNKLLTIQKNLIYKREQEKIILLKELNHRTKNNLQMISSLLNLQSNKLTGHPAKEAILAGKYRVEALSLVHRKLYQEGVDSKINIKDYIEELILGLFYGYNANFTPQLNIDNLAIDIDTAVPLALIINELIINALKYAYNTIENPELEVAIYKKKIDFLTIMIKDNGIGFSSKEEEKKHSFGLKLLNSLVQQLNGTITQIPGNGTHWEIAIKTN